MQCWPLNGCGPVEQAVKALGCMEHRGACSADKASGDGAGVMTQVPWDLLKQQFPDIQPDSTGRVPLQPLQL